MVVAKLSSMELRLKWVRLSSFLKVTQPVTVLMFTSRLYFSRFLHNFFLVSDRHFLNKFLLSDFCVCVCVCVQCGFARFYHLSLEKCFS